MFKKMNKLSRSNSCHKMERGQFIVDLFGRKLSLRRVWACSFWEFLGVLGQENTVFAF